MDKIFEMFFQGTEKSNVNYGLGLYLAKKAVEKMGGSITITKPVNDTTFEIILPHLQMQPSPLSPAVLVAKE